MKSALLAFFCLFLAAPIPAIAMEQLIPAGSLIQCTISEPKLSSKTVAVGDPILCSARYTAPYGDYNLPFDSFLEGRFKAYKDPGHLVGKGWMELKFDRMVIEPDTVIPMNAKVVDVPGYNIDRDGRILGKGHAVRDTVAWMIPILWPIDLLNLPRRGPRPTLKEETRLTLKVMDDMQIPITAQPERDPSGLIQRSPSSYTSPPSETTPNASAPLYYPMAAGQAPEYWRSAPPPAYASRWETSPAPGAQKRSPYPGEGDRYPLTLVFNDGRRPERVYNYMLTPSAVYVLDGYRRVIPFSELNLGATQAANREAGVRFLAPGGASQEPSAVAARWSP